MKPLAPAAQQQRPKMLRYVIAAAVLVGFTFLFLHLNLRSHSAVSEHHHITVKSVSNTGADGDTAQSSNQVGGLAVVPEGSSIAEAAKTCVRIPPLDADADAAVALVMPAPAGAAASKAEKTRAAAVRAAYAAAGAAANCPNCRSWPSFLPFRTRYQCRDILSAVAAIPAYDMAAMHKRDRHRVLSRNREEKDEARRRRALLRDRRPSAPFVTGDGFRAAAEFIFDETTVPTWDALNLKSQLKRTMPAYGHPCQRYFVDDDERKDDAAVAKRAFRAGGDKEDGGGGVDADPTRLHRIDGPGGGPMQLADYHFRPAPAGANKASRVLYWEHVARNMQRLTEDAVLQNHNGVLRWLRFDCASYGSVVFVQTHYLDKFIEEVLPIFEERKRRKDECEAKLAEAAANKDSMVGRETTEDPEERARRKGVVHVDKGPPRPETADERAERLKRLPCHPAHHHGRNSRGFKMSALPAFTLVTHNSDYSAPWDSSNTRGVKSDPADARFDKQIARLLKSPLLHRWFGQNMVLSPERQARIMAEYFREHAPPMLPMHVLDEYRALRKELEAKAAEFQAGEAERMRKEVIAKQQKALADAQAAAAAAGQELGDVRLWQQQQQQEKPQQQQAAEPTRSPQENDPFLPERAWEREVERRRRKPGGEHYVGTAADREEWMRNNNVDEADIDFIALHRPQEAAFKIISRKYPQYDLGALEQAERHVKQHRIMDHHHPRGAAGAAAEDERQQQQQQEAADADGGNKQQQQRRRKTRAKMIEAKLVPIPIGLENRYNRFGSFVDREYAAAAGCHHADAYLFDGGARPNEVDYWERQEREQAVKFHEDYAAMPRETGRPFVSFSVKTNKREREEAVKAVADNFAAASAPSSLTEQQLDKCVAHMMAQMQAVGRAVDAQRRKMEGAAAENRPRENQDDEGEAEDDGKKKNGGVATVPPSGSSRESKQQLSLRTYLAKLKCFAFTLAPHGHGVDTHRFWEALYAGSVPVAAASAADEQLLRQLPALLLNSNVADDAANGGNDKARRRSFHYVKGTYGDLLRPEALRAFWCGAAKAAGIAGVLRWHDLDEPHRGLWRAREMGDAYVKPRHVWFNYSASLRHPDDAAAAAAAAAAKKDDDAFAYFSTPRFEPEFLDMGFWAHIVTREEHPHAEIAV